MFDTFLLVGKWYRCFASDSANNLLRNIDAETRMIDNSTTVCRTLPLGANSPDNNTLHTEPRAARLLEAMMFAAAR